MLAELSRCGSYQHHALQVNRKYSVGSSMIPMMPRDWQQRAAQMAMHKNIIVNADTGTGKTFVAILAIHSFLESNPKGKCALLAPTRVLANQHAETVKDTSPAGSCSTVMQEDVALLTGHTTEGWTHEQFADMRKRASVMVFTYQVLLDAIVNGWLSMKSFSLIVVDECHNARKNSPVAKLVGRPEFWEHGVRVLGLTASFAGSGASEEWEFLDERRDLEQLLRSEVITFSDAGSAAQEKTWEKVIYTAHLCDEGRRLAEVLCEGIAKELESLAGQGKGVAKEARQLPNVLVELGACAFQEALEHFMARVSKTMQGSLQQPHDEEICRVLACAEDVSDKVLAVTRILEREAKSGSHSEKLRAIIFVKETILAQPLGHRLQSKLKSIGMQVAVATGIGSMSESDRSSNFAAFRKGRAHVLVCTDCGLEGVDVPECRIVIRFSKFDVVRSKVQGSGTRSLPPLVHPRVPIDSMKHIITYVLSCGSTLEFVSSCRCSYC
eukprot:6467283-Amphidinium_carterae.2